MEDLCKLGALNGKLSSLCSRIGMPLGERDKGGLRRATRRRRSLNCPFSSFPYPKAFCAETHNAETHNSVNMVTECPGRRGSGWTVGRRPSNVTAAAVDHPMNSGRDPAWKSCGGLETRVGAVQALQ